MKPLIIAHRGASFKAPENTLSAVKLAWELDADGVEIDVQLTKDKQVVVYHDSNTLRYNGDSRLISECNYSDLLKLDVGRFKGEKYINEKIPLLHDVICTVPKNKILQIEVKSGPQIITHLRDIIEKSGLDSKQIIFISFRRDSILQIKKTRPDIEALRIYQLKQSIIFYKIFPSLKRMIKQVISDKLDGMAISFVPAVNRLFINTIKMAGLLVYFWTINDPKCAAFLYKAGVNGITTDRPDWLRKQINSETGRI